MLAVSPTASLSAGPGPDGLDHALEVIRPMIEYQRCPPNWPRPLRPGGIPVLVAGSGEQRLPASRPSTPT